MNEVQKIQLNMAIEVDRICKKYKLNYSLDGGTLIGAIRHKGFIPWDDDLDICMLREDYNRFLEIAQKELGTKYFLQTSETDKNYGLIFSKIRANNTTYIEKMSKDVDIHNGIYIDIFPIDYTSTDEKKAKKVLKKIIILRMILLVKCNYKIDNSTLLKKISIIILKIIGMFMTKKCILKLINKIIDKNSNFNSKLVAIYGTTLFNKGIYKKEYFKEYKRANFENENLSIIKRYDRYLTDIYGDYMTPPPLNERGDRHSIIKIEINNKK